MTDFFIRIYRYFRAHQVQYWTLMIGLFAFFGFYASQIHLEEDLAKMLPSSKNEDGSTKLTFADLKIKDKTFLLFQGQEGVAPERIVQVADSFVNKLQAWDVETAPEGKLIDNIFSEVDLSKIAMPAYEYIVYSSLPTFVDTAVYSGLDTLYTVGNVSRQIEKNLGAYNNILNSDDPRMDKIKMFLENNHEVFLMDPLGMHDAIAEPFKGIMSGMGGNFSLLETSQLAEDSTMVECPPHFFTRDSTTCIAFLTPTFTSFNTGAGARLFEHLNEEIRTFTAAFPDVKIMYHGAPARGAYNSWQTKADLRNTIVGSLLVVLFFIFFCFRNWNTIPLLLLPVGFGTIFGLAMMYFIKGQFSLLALGIGAIVLGVALSYVLHVITHYKYVSDPEQVLRDQVKPVFLGCLTTVGSFMGLIFVKTELLQDFGMFATFAIVGTTLFSLMFLPQFFNAEKNKINRRAFAAIDKFNAYPFDRKKPLLWIIGILSGIGVMFYFYGGTDFDADMRNLGYRSENVNESEDLYTEKTRSGLKQQYFAASGENIEEALVNFEVLADRLDSLQAAGFVKSYTPTHLLFVPQEKQQQRLDAWNNYWTAERVDSVKSLVDQTEYSPELREDIKACFDEMVTSEYVTDTLYKRDIIPAGFLSTLMEQNATNCLVFSSVTCEMDTVRSDSTAYHRICDAIANEPNLMVLDTYYYTTDGLKELNDDFNVLQWVSMLFVLIVLLISFRFNWRHTLLGFMPIIISWVIVLGAMVIFDRQFNLINIIISTFIFGIGVDYSIFVMSGLIGNSKEGNRQDRNLLHYHKTAILFSAVTLIVTVASMLFAKHPAIQSVGFATLVGMVSAVIISYVAQPACFRFLNKKKKELK